MNCAQMYLITFIRRLLIKNYNKLLVMVCQVLEGSVADTSCCVALSLDFSCRDNLLSGDPSWYLFL